MTSMRTAALGLLFGSTIACHRGATDPAQESPPPVAEPAPEVAKMNEDDPQLLRGTIEAIRLHNINKALGHYTYNVELTVRHHGIRWAGEFDPAQVPDTVTVRIDKIFWDRLSQARRDAIAPAGPAPHLDVTRYDAYEVGHDVALRVTFTSPDLAMLAR